MYILLWILFGCFIGWIASVLTNENSRMGLVANIVVGLLGAVIGGLITTGLGLGTINVFTWQGTLFSIIGAVILLVVLGAFNARRR